MSMKPRHTRRPDRSARSTRLRLACALLAAGLALPPPLYAQTAPPRKTTPAVGSSTLVTLNFVNQDIEAVTRAVAAMIERQIVVDPRVRGTITLYSEQPLSVRDAYLNYQVALRGLGFSVVESGGLLKLVPEAEAKLQTGVVSVGEAPTRGDQVITQVFTLRYENPNNLVAVLRPLISANNTINANPGNNALVITDYADNLQRLGKIVAALDIPSATDIEIIPLQHAVASDIATLVQRLSNGAGAVPGAAVGGAVTVLAEARSNSLIVRAPNAARLAGIRSQIEKLDRPTPGGGPGGNIWVVHLKNADSTKLATVLRAAFSGGGGSGGGSSASSTGFSGTNTTPGAPGQPGATPGTAPLAPSAQPSTGGFVQADPATNSLIVSGPEPLYRQVRAMIDQLDSRRAQVYIESMIVEISGDNAADFGFQWQGLLGNKGDNYGLAAGTNFTPSGGTGNILNISALAAGASAATGIPVGEGLNLGLIRNYGGTYALAAIARLLQSQTNTNIVSTPNLITLDNEEAKIVVGSNVPFITGQSITTGGSTSNPFQTIERKDVGITLRIKPQVGESGTVRMAIFQESSSVDGTVAPGTTNAGPSTKKRSIESNVVVDDGQIIVLGGLIEDSFTENKSQIPLLGDLPLVGALFRSQSRQKKRTNLMVFIRPVVMRDTASADRLSLDRYDLIRARQEAAQPVPSMLLPIEGAPMLPPLSQSIVQPVPTGPKAPSVLAPTQTPTPTPEPALR
jgi:general secretion pathway protein D